MPVPKFVTNLWEKKWAKLTPEERWEHVRHGCQQFPEPRVYESEEGLEVCVPVRPWRTLHTAYLSFFIPKEEILKEIQ